MMKATVINDTTFRLFTVSLTGFVNLKHTSYRLLGLWCPEHFPDEIVDWMKEYTPSFKTSIEVYTNLDDETTTCEYYLSFGAPAEAVAFKLRWL